MIEALTAWGISKLAAYVGVSVVGGIAAIFGAWIIKKIPFGRFAKWSGDKGEKHGAAVTKFFNKKIPAIYEPIIEPIFVDTIVAATNYVAGFIRGLKSDNKN